MYLLIFSEENVWHLCDAVRKKSTERFDNCYAVFISNLNRTVGLTFKTCFKNPSCITFFIGVT